MERDGTPELPGEMTPDSIIPTRINSLRPIFISGRLPTLEHIAPMGTAISLCMAGLQALSLSIT